MSDEFALCPSSKCEYGDYALCPYTNCHYVPAFQRGAVHGHDPQLADRLLDRIEDRLLYLKQRKGE
jgi:hypothetical protein